MCTEDDRDIEFLRVSQQLENVQPGCLLPQASYETRIVNRTRSVEIRSPYASGAREGFITLRRELCDRRASSYVYHAARHALNLRIAKITDLKKRHAGFLFSNRVDRCLAGFATRRSRKQLWEARQAYSWNTASEFLNAAQERSGRWRAANKPRRGKKHAIAEYDAAVVEMLRKVVVDEEEARLRRKSLFDSVEKGHAPHDERIRNALQIGVDLINVSDITYYLAHASFFGALNACDIYTEFSEIRGALEVLAFLGRVNLGVADPTLLQANAFLRFMQRYERWVAGAGETYNLECEVVSSVATEFGLTEHFPALDHLCRARLQGECYRTEPIASQRRYWAMI